VLLFNSMWIRFYSIHMIDDSVINTFVTTTASFLLLLVMNVLIRVYILFV